MSSIIEVEKLERTFGEQKAVDGITFVVEPGEVFGLLGPNGAGKTTTVRLLNGILPPSAGRARVFGMDPETQGAAIRQRTGVLTETPALYERLSARENLEFFATLQSLAEPQRSRRVDEMLAFFDLSSRASDKVETFSKGMKQRLALARALVHQPPLLFLDEPSSGLDPEAAQQVDDLIASLGRTDGQTVILATHNLLEAQRLCDRVAVMNQGKILAIGSLQELARKLWPVTWVDILFHVKPSDRLDESLMAQRGVKQIATDPMKKTFSVQVENDDVIPELIRILVQQGASIRSVRPRDYTLEDIYFALQAGDA